VKIYALEGPADGPTHRLTDTLKGHSGAVWCVSWAHPKFGALLASSSYDGRIIVWRESAASSSAGGAPAAGGWTKAHDYAGHTASVNIVAWAPPEAGCVLAAASSDGAVSLLELRDNEWRAAQLPAHALGANAVAWAPAAPPAAVAGAADGAAPVARRRFVSGGSDCAVKIWDYAAETGSYACVNTLVGHTDWVRDVAWAPTLLATSYIASASQDKTVRVWSIRGDDVAAQWECAVLDFDAVAWRVSWSLSGNVLAVSTGDNRVTLWKERLKGGWECFKTIEE